MSYSLTCLFNHATHLVILSLATTALICLYLVITQITFEFSVMILLFIPFLWLPSSSCSICIFSLLFCIDSARAPRYSSTWVTMIKSYERTAEAPGWILKTLTANLN